jgi:CheY-like chemotaxis protein
MNPKLSPPRGRWLVVDDNPEVCELMALLLNGLGMAEVEHHTSSRQAFSRASQCSFDLVVTDRDMPGLDGLEFARRLHIGSPNIKIVLVSAHLDDLTYEDLRRAGICAVLAKPFSLPRLELMIRGLMCEPAPAPGGSTSPEILAA